MSHLHSSWPVLPLQDSRSCQRLYLSTANSRRLRFRVPAGFGLHAVPSPSTAPTLMWPHEGYNQKPDSSRPIGTCSGVASSFAHMSNIDERLTKVHLQVSQVNLKIPSSPYGLVPTGIPNRSHVSIFQVDDSPAAAIHLFPTNAVVSMAKHACNPLSLILTPPHPLILKTPIYYNMNVMEGNVY